MNDRIPSRIVALALMMVLAGACAGSGKPGDVPANDLLDVVQDVAPDTSVTPDTSDTPDTPDTSDAPDTSDIPATRCGGVPLPADPVADQVTVFQGGAEGYPVYRIPAFVTTASGVLVAFAEARQSLSDPGAGLIVVVMKRSLDCGQTWTPLAVVAANGEGDAHNPVALDVPDPAGGSTLFLFFSRRPASIGGEFDLPPGLDGTSASIWVMTSRDDGATWAAARNITAGVKPADWAIMSFGPGRGLLTRWGTQAAPAGRIVAPGWYTSGTSTDEGDFVVLSDDGGQNFRLGGRTTGAGEPQVVELTDGTLLMDARNNPRKLFRSTDGGQTWSEPTDGLPMEPIMSSVVRHMAKRDGDPVDRLVHSGLGASGRVNIRAWQSLDEGATWTGETLLNHDMAQYSVLSVLDDRSIGMVYEGYGIIGEIFGPAIFFARFDVALLEKGVAASPAASALPVPARR